MTYLGPLLRISQGNIQVLAGTAVTAEARLGKDPLPSSPKLLRKSSSLLCRTEGFSFLLTTDQWLPSVPRGHLRAPQQSSLQCDSLLLPSQ